MKKLIHETGAQIRKFGSENQSKLSKSEEGIYNINMNERNN